MALPHSWHATLALTVLVHARLQALLQAAGLALVAVGLVHRAHTRAGLASVDEPPPDAALEEAAAAVAGIDAVVLPAAGVCAHLAEQRGAQGFTGRRALRCQGHRDAGAR